MREVLVLGVLVAGLWSVSSAQAAVPSMGMAPAALSLAPARAGSEALSCQSLIKELRSFQKAQSSLMRTFVQKNETLAETLDLYKFDFQGKKGKLKAGDYLSMGQSAEAFRAHGQRENRLVQRFETSSAQLLDQVIHCLQNPKIVSQAAAPASANVLTQ